MAEDMSRISRSTVASPVGNATISPGISTGDPTNGNVRPQSQLSTRNREIAPFLSLDHLHSAQSQPQSPVTSQGSSFLTPPMTEPWNLSPPPRPDAEDYISARVGGGRRTRRKVKQIRKHYNTREHTREESQALADHLKSDSQTGSWISVHSDYNGSVANAGKLDSSSDPSQERSSSRTGQFDEDNTKTKARIAIADPIKSIGPCEVDEEDSPAVQCLRRLSQPSSGDTSPTESVGRRMSQALMATLNKFRHNTADTGLNRHSTMERPSTGQKPQNYRDGNRRLPFPKDTRSSYAEGVRPASITLRKASIHPTTEAAPALASTSASSYGASERALSPQSSVPCSEPIAFRSTFLNSRSERRQSCAMLLGHSSSTGLNVIREGASSAQTCKLSNEKNFLKSKPSIKRQSEAAGTALTYADVHAMPGNLTKSRRSSTNAGQSIRRLSVVQFRSRDSVHEVIWREDETPSGSSSGTEPSPKRFENLSRQVTTTPNSGTPAERSRSDTLKEDRMPDLENSASHGNLFQWSWSRSAGSAEDEPTPTARVPDPSADHSNTLLTRYSSQNTKNNAGMSGQDRSKSEPLLAEKPSVHFFPPLRDRSSTSEWCQAPLVDLNDPEAGRVGQQQNQRSRYSAGGGTGTQLAPRDSFEGREDQTPFGKLGSHFYAQLRAESGRVGSSIGNSARQRIRSLH